MFDLEKALQTRRRTYQYRPVLLAEDLDELEAHIRDPVKGLMIQGLSEKEAFRRAPREMGDYDTTEGEYPNVFWRTVTRKGTLGQVIGSPTPTCARALGHAKPSTGTVASVSVLFPTL